MRAEVQILNLMRWISLDFFMMPDPKKYMEQQYLHLLQKLIDTENHRDDRTGIGTRSLFGEQIRCDLREGFPLLTTKKINLKAIIHELLWFISGSTNIKYLNDNGVHIWDEWAGKNGNLGPVYGAQWRRCNGIDQLARCIHSIQTNPYSRRHMINSWNVAEVDSMALPPCHVLQQYYVEKMDDEMYLSLQVYQRSGDIFLGVPFNIASYALLLMMTSQATNLTPHKLIFAFGDIHLYNNHIEQAKTQISRAPRPLPKMRLQQDIFCMDDFRYEHFALQNYHPHPAIPAPIAV